MNNYSHLSLEERLKVYQYKQEKCGVREIARRINRDKSTISRELSRNKYSDAIDYLPDIAQQKAEERKYILEFKIDQNETLKYYILVKYSQYFSRSDLNYSK